MPFRHPGWETTLCRFRVTGGGFNGLGQHRPHPGGRVVGEAIDHEHALDHVGRHVGERSALELYRDHGAAWVAAERAGGAGNAGWAPEGRHDQPGGSRRGSQATSRLAEEESARFHAVSIPCGYDSHAGAG